MRTLVLRVWCWVVLGSALLPGFARAQSTNLTALVEVSQNPAVLGNTLTYTISVTNVSGFSFTDLVVSNTLPSSFTFVSATNNLGVVSASGNIVRLVANLVTNNGVVVFAVSARPTVLGLFTNNVSFTSIGLTLESTNLDFATRVVSGFSDLAVQMTGPPDVPLVDDLVTYTITVTNAGPAAATSLFLTNRFATNLLFQSISPTNTSLTTSSTNFVLPIGTLASGSAAQYLVTYRPVSGGSYTITSRVTADNLDTNLTDNVFIAALSVSAPLSATLSLSLIDASPVLDQQSGLMAQRVRVSNTGGTTALGVRVLVAGLTTRLAGVPDLLWNAVGTNGGLPFVLSGSPLLSGNSVDLRLEFFFPTRTPAPGLTLSAAPALTPDLGVSTNTSFSITSATLLSAGHVLIEFPAVAGDRYAIIYSADTSFTNAFLARPTLIAPADKVLWIDDGPPKTLSAPVSVSSRYYRVIHNP